MIACHYQPYRVTTIHSCLNSGNHKSQMQHLVPSVQCQQESRFFYCTHLGHYLGVDVVTRILLQIGSGGVVLFGIDPALRLGRIVVDKRVNTYPTDGIPSVSCLTCIKVQHYLLALLGQSMLTRNYGPRCRYFTLMVWMDRQVGRHIQISLPP